MLVLEIAAGVGLALYGPAIVAAALNNWESAPRLKRPPRTAEERRAMWRGLGLLPLAVVVIVGIGMLLRAVTH